MALKLQVIEKQPVNKCNYACKHVAIIMDGNRRWAKSRGLPGIAGHWKGAETLSCIVEGALDLGIKSLTAYSFSSENWRRPEEEIQSLMELFEVQITKEKQRLCKNGVRLSTIGDLSNFPPSVTRAFEECEEATKNGNRMDLILALGYGARDEICRAVKGILKDYNEGKVDSSEVTESTISQYLDTCATKDPDLIIRTGGRQALSNFMLWQSAYSEFSMFEKMWPDFSKEDLVAALEDFETRRRRFGK